jgi:hypothetical protein
MLRIPRWYHWGSNTGDQSDEPDCQCPNQVPRVLDCLVQVVEPESLLLALHFAAESANPYFRIGYNSLGAYGTINHLHFQVCATGSWQPSMAAHG